ncbi:M50 family metallopeptidase [Skermania piniformis]|uniref:Zinc metalloprotease Rip1 n=1 Tax=Skermania pinensis TaxID=39122 RepID=A0ABX8S837_9ACTN|nr:site-2 protease family protein [Skermania piniformis]QXQ12675.1 site-2 protease family protein [Skermania piniformis]
MVFALGVVLFALGICISVALHEGGHMWTAKAFGMKVRRYYIGFGPKIFSFRRGETEYGLKALPLGGFCDIAGMTALDEVAPDEVERAMYRRPAWQRQIVMVGGIAMNFVLGFLLIVLLAVGWGLPDENQPPETMLGRLDCVAAQQPDGSYAECTGAGPAQQAGLRPGDVVTAVAGKPVDTWTEFQRETQAQSGTFEYTVRRDGATLTIPVTPQQVQRSVVDPDTGTSETKVVGAVGVAPQPLNPPIRYNPIAAIPASLSFTGEMFVEVARSLVQMPAKVVDLWDAVTGGERSLDTPVSVYGASVIGGETAERGQWAVFIGLLASLNFFLGAFNLLPLLPLDGGHMAVTAYENLRNRFRRRRGLPQGEPVDYLKLMPATYVVLFVGGAYMLLTLTADIVNPVRLF